MHVLNTLMPVFLVIAVGAVLRRTNFLSGHFIDDLNRLVYWVGLPCLLFYEIATAPFDYSSAGKTFLIILIGNFGCIALGYIAARLIHVPGPDVGTFVQGAFRGNLVYMGLPLVMYSFLNADGVDVNRMKTITMLVVSMIVPVYNICAVIVLLASRHKIGRDVPGKVFRQIITNPLFLACILGIIYSTVFSHLPAAIGYTFKAISQMALPLALLCIGGTLVQEKVAGRIMYAVTASVIKVAAAPVIGFLAALVLTPGPGEMRIAMLFLACPTAAASYVMADQLGGDRQLAAAIVVISTLLSLPALSIVIGLF
jgi:predicted permease